MTRAERRVPRSTVTEAPAAPRRVLSAPGYATETHASYRTASALRKPLRIIPLSR
ncbi:hypothetical protein RKD28_000245 [Streptomyces sp. SAI-229]